MSRSLPAASPSRRVLSRLAFASLALVASCQSAEQAEDAEASTGPVQGTSSPSPPPATPAASPGSSDGAASRASTQTAIAPAMAAAPDAGAATGRSPASTAPAPSFASCIGVGATYDDCEVIHVSVSEARRCIQLAIDNCGQYGRTGLDAELPVSWRLASASVSARAEPCGLGVYYPESTVISAASGEIAWDESTRQPSALTLDVTLEVRDVSGTQASYEVATGEPLNPQRCPD